jgi:PAS domain S-box-containing protein
MFVVARYLHINKKVYQSLIQNMPLALIVLDKDYNVEKWNKRAEQIFGWSKKEVLHRSVFDFLVVHQDIAGVRSMLNKVKYDQNRRQLINKNYTKEGEIINCSWTNTIVGDKKSQKIICMAIDLSELDELDCFLPSQKNLSHHEPHNFAQTPDHQTLDATVSMDMTDPLSAAEQLAELMNTALKIWFIETKKTKIELAEESQLWRVTLDGGAAKTRTLDKYLSAETMPANPRWRIVIDTALFVIKHCKNKNLAHELEQMVEAYIQQHKN